MSSLEIIQKSSPNFNERPDGMSADLLLLHYTGMQSGSAALDWLCTQESNVSAHYLVEEDGRIFQMVDEDKRAWHAGVASWMGESNINGCSIGIEIVNPGHEFGYPEFEAAQMDAVEALCADIVKRRSIAPGRVLAHSDVAPGRKADPGEKFPWARLAAQGIGLWLEPVPIVKDEGSHDLQLGDRGDLVAELQFQLADFGYGMEVLGRYDVKTQAVVQAFQRHYRPALVNGIADASTVATLKQLREHSASA